MARGFTLIELLVAGTISLLLVAGAFGIVTHVQRTSLRQAEASERVAAARVAMEAMARDLRGAGDALDLLPAPCLGDKGFAPTDALCPALLDAHPWRVAIARNVWVDADGDGSTWSAADSLPPPARRFEQEPRNVVTYRFVPREDAEPRPMRGGVGGSRSGVLGRIERVENPFGFVGEAPRVTVLLDGVLLDDRMRSDPQDPGRTDPRYDHALFLYRVAARSGELAGALGTRSTSLGGAFLSPPLRFFAPAPPPPYTAAAPWLGAAYADAKQIVGLGADATPAQRLLAAGTGSLDPTDPTSDLRAVLDRNRIRAVRIAFKVVDEREKPDLAGGLDLDGNPANGTARVHAFETTVELKVLASRLGGL